MGRQALVRTVLLALGCLAWGGCAPGLLIQAPRLSGLDSPSATCRNSLSGCLALYGKEVGSAGLVLKEECGQLAKTARRKGTTWAQQLGSFLA